MNWAEPIIFMMGLGTLGLHYSFTEVNSSNRFITLCLLCGLSGREVRMVLSSFSAKLSWQLGGPSLPHVKNYVPSLVEVKHLWNVGRVRPYRIFDSSFVKKTFDPKPYLTFV